MLLVDQLHDLVIGLHNFGRFDEERRAGVAAGVDDAAQLAAVLGLQRQDGAFTALRRVGKLQDAGDLGVAQHARIDLTDFTAKRFDGSAQFEEAFAGVVAHLSALVDGAIDLLGQRAEVAHALTGFCDEWIRFGDRFKPSGDRGSRFERFANFVKFARIETGWRTGSRKRRADIMHTPQRYRPSGFERILHLAHLIEPSRDGFPPFAGREATGEILAKRAGAAVGEGFSDVIELQLVEGVLIHFKTRPLQRHVITVTDKFPFSQSPTALPKTTIFEFVTNPIFSRRGEVGRYNTNNRPN